MRLQMHETRIEGVGGNLVPTLWYTEVEVGIGNGVYKATVVTLLLVWIISVAAHNCDLSLCLKLFTIGEQDLQCIPEGVRANCGEQQATCRAQKTGHAWPTRRGPRSGQVLLHLPRNRHPVWTWTVRRLTMYYYELCSVLIY